MIAIGTFIAGAQSQAIPTALGSILSENFGSGSLSDYTVVNGAGSISIVGGKLRLSAGAGNFASYIEYTKVSSAYKKHMLEKWKQVVKFVCPTITGTTYGFTVGVRSSNAATKIDQGVRLALDSGGPAGTFYFYSLNNGAVNQSTQTGVTLTGGTTYILEVERAKNVITATLKSSTGTTLISRSNTYNITTQNSIWSHNVGSFCIFNNGGTIDIESWTVETTAQSNIDLLGIGDSMMHGLYAGTNVARYTEASAINSNISFEILAGIDQGVADCRAYVDLAILMKPRVVYTNCFSNSIANGIAQATYRADYEAMVNSLKNGIPGIRILHGVPVARGYDFATLVANYLTTTYPTESQVNLFTTTKQAGNNNLLAGYNIGDNIHMNAAGNAACVTLLDSLI